MSMTDQAEAFEAYPRLSEQVDSIEALAKGLTGQRGRVGGVGFDIEVRALLSTSTAGAFQAPASPELPPTMPRRHVRDLLRPPVPSGRLIAYGTEVVQDQAGGATAVVEGSAKPETEFKFNTGDPLYAGTVAAWVPVTGEILDDTPGFQEWIDVRLGDQFLCAEDVEMLLGAGGTDRMRGFFEWDDIQTQAAVTGDPYATFGAAFSKVENVGGTVDGVVVSALDYWAARSTRHANGFDTMPIDQNGNIFGRPTVVASRCPSGRALVGSFRLGSTFREAQKAQVAIGTMHDDYLVKNKSAVKIWGMEAVVLHRPDWFVDVEIAFS